MSVSHVLGQAQYKNIETGVEMVVQARDSTSEANRLAERDPTLKGEEAIMPNLSKGVAVALK